MIPVTILFRALVISSMYAFMALGLSLIYGVGKVLNLTHGSLFAWGGYIAWLLLSFNLNFQIAFFLTIIIMFLLGISFEKIFVFPLRKRLKNWEIPVVVITLGAALFFDSLIRLLFGPGYKILPELVPGVMSIRGFNMSLNELTIIFLAVVLFLLLNIFLKTTKLGMAMRAVSQDVEGAMIVGVSIDRIIYLTFGMSTALAAIAGMLLAPTTLLYPQLGWEIIMKALVIVVLGGLGSVNGTLIAAFILGMSEMITTYYLGGIWALPLFAVTLLIILVFKPSGLAGTWG